VSDTVAPRPGSTRDGALPVPARATGVEVLGTSRGSGYKHPPGLARRPDGQVVQLTPLLLHTLEAVDGERDLAEVAAVVSRASGRGVSADNAAVLVDRLREQGLLLRPDGSAPEVRRTHPLLGLSLRVQVSDPDRTRRLTAPFAALFHPILVLPVLLGFAWTCWWLLAEKGLASATSEVFSRPGLLLSLLVLTALSAGFHEFGHAAAARRGGATPGVMGAGLYLVWPAFYTDVTDSYRLGRVGRLRTDLGGLYFNAIVVLLSVAAWWVSRVDAVLLLVVAQVLQMARQLLPLVRFDGYHVLADLTGVPDLYARIGPTLRSLVPGRAEPEATALRPWARAVITAWVLMVVPLLVLLLVAVVLALPRVVGTALAGSGREWDLARVAWAETDLVGALGHGLGAGLVLLPVAAVGYLLVRLLRRTTGGILRRTRGRPVRRALALVTAVALLAVLALAWWPDPERYRPVQPWEGGTVSDLVAYASPAAGAAVGARGNGTVLLPADAELPTRERPQLAAVLVPRHPSGQDGVSAGDAGTAGGPSGDGVWVFPFDRPLAPDADDNQALAAATQDGETVYDVAFALVWADGTQAVRTDNEAYALASCEDCNAVAVAFQVVLVVGEGGPGLAPTNVAVSVTQDCVRCLTWSTAVQLFITLEQPLGTEARTRLEELWEEVLAYGADIGQQPLDEIQARLTEFEAQVVALVEEDQGPLVDPGSSPSESPTGSPTASPSGSVPVSPSPSPTGSPSDSGSAGGTGSPSPSGSGSATPSSGTSPSSSATPTGSTSPSASGPTAPSASATSSP
jgi:putative peptide zinc metalloprotease protein